jgi:hypothetical protein
MNTLYFTNFIKINSSKFQEPAAFLNSGKLIALGGHHKQPANHKSTSVTNLHAISLPACRSGGGGGGEGSCHYLACNRFTLQR